MSADRIRHLWIAATGRELSCAPIGPGLAVDGAWEWSRHGLDAALITGCGPVAAAASLSWFLGTREVEGIIAIGIAGCYPGSSCRVGGVYRICEDRLIDLGAEDGDGSVLTLPFPGLECRLRELWCPPEFSRIPVARGATTSLCTGTVATATRRRASGADLESMEGAAWAEVAIRFGAPLAQIRSVSNVASSRNRETWDVNGAIAALTEVLAEEHP